MKIELINGAINPIALQWGPFRVHWYGIIIASAVILALWLSIREGRRLGIPEDDFYDALLWSLPIAVICARTYYVVFQWSYYSLNHHSLFLPLSSFECLALFRCVSSECYFGPGHWSLGEFYESGSLWSGDDESPSDGSTFANLDHQSNVHRRGLPGADLSIRIGW